MIVVKMTLQSKEFQLYQDDGKVIMKGTMHFQGKQLYHFFFASLLYGGQL